jgi:hypothetical protein
VFLGGHLLLLYFSSATVLFALVIFSSCVATGYLFRTYAHASQRVSIGSVAIYKLLPFGVLAVVLPEMMPIKLTALMALAFLALVAAISFAVWVYLVHDAIVEIMKFEQAQPHEAEVP